MSAILNCPGILILQIETNSHPRHKAIHHAFFAGFVELDGEFVAVDRAYFAVAEFLMEHAVAEAERRSCPGRARHP